MIIYFETQYSSVDHIIQKDGLPVFWSDWINSNIYSQVSKDTKVFHKIIGYHLIYTLRFFLLQKILFNFNDTVFIKTSCLETVNLERNLLMSLWVYEETIPCLPLCLVHSGYSQWNLLINRSYGRVLMNVFLNYLIYKWKNLNKIINISWSLLESIWLP